MMDRNEKCLAITDADFPRAAAAYAWVDAGGELVVEYRRENVRSGLEETVRRAVVDAEEIDKMAAYYQVTVNELPAMSDEACGVGYATTLSEVERAFGDALEVILESGANYKFK